MRVDCADVLLVGARGVFEVDADVFLRWVVQIGVVARRRSSSPAHFQENASVTGALL
jgi:diketogulonate reductase-like aldo/keto reductase